MAQGRACGRARPIRASRRARHTDLDLPPSTPARTSRVSASAYVRSHVRSVPSSAARTEQTGGGAPRDDPRARARAPEHEGARQRTTKEETGRPSRRWRRERGRKHEKMTERREREEEEERAAKGPTHNRRRRARAHTLPSQSSSPSLAPSSHALAAQPARLRGDAACCAIPGAACCEIPGAACCTIPGAACCAIPGATCCAIAGALFSGGPPGSARAAARARRRRKKS